MRSEPQSARTLVWALPFSLAATHRIDVSFSSSGYLDVSVHRVPFHTLWIGVWITEVCSVRFPHSDISGSLAICASPELFAAYHVLLRLLVPRHPPCALFSITNSISQRLGCLLDHTCIALHALALGHFFTSFCRSVYCYLIDNFTSDVLLIFLFINIFLVCSFQGTW